MRIYISIAAVGFSVLMGMAVADSASAFSCQSGRPGSNSTCSCSGRDDCKDMRHSEMCKGDLTCGQGKCSCAAALVADTGDTGGTVVGPKVKVLTPSLQQLAPATQN
jgi:hypothetical protein